MAKKRKKNRHHLKRKASQKRQAIAKGYRQPKIRRKK